MRRAVRRNQHAVVPPVQVPNNPIQGELPGPIEPLPLAANEGEIPVEEVLNQIIVEEIINGPIMLPAPLPVGQQAVPPPILEANNILPEGPDYVLLGGIAPEQPGQQPKLQANVKTQLKNCSSCSDTSN
jgi:hypothetical protein